MSKDLLKEVVESLVNEKTIKYIIEQKVSSLLENYFDSAIKIKARELANVASKEKIDEMIEEMFLKEIVIDDGWSTPKTYKSFEELVKERIYDNTKTTAIENAVRRRVDEKIKEMCKKVASENEEKLANEVLMKLGEEK